MSELETETVNFEAEAAKTTKPRKTAKHEDDSQSDVGHEEESHKQQKRTSTKSKKHEDESIEFDDEAPKPSKSRSSKSKRTEESKPKKAKKSHAPPPPVVEEYSGDSYDEDDNHRSNKRAKISTSERKSTKKATTSRVRKSTRPLLPEEEEEEPEGEERPVRKEQNVTSAFNTLHNKTNGKNYKPGDKGYFSLDDLILEYASTDDPEAWKQDKRYLDAAALFKKVNDEWKEAMVKWRENNQAKAEYKDRIRTARRKRTAMERQLENERKEEEYQKMQLTVKAIQSGLVHPSAVQPIVTQNNRSAGPVSSMQDVIAAVFSARSEMSTDIDNRFTELLSRLVPNYTHQAPAAAPKHKPKKQSAHVIAIHDASSDEDDV